MLTVWEPAKRSTRFYGEYVGRKGQAYKKLPEKVSHPSITPLLREWLTAIYVTAPLSDPFRGRSIIPCRAADCQFLLSHPWGSILFFHFFPKLRVCLRGPGVGVHLAAPGFAICGTAVPFCVGGSGEGEERQRLIRVSGPDKSPLGGQLLRFLGIDFAVVDLEETNHPPGAGPADKAIFLACLALQHVFGNSCRLEVWDILLCGIEFRAGHGGGFCLQVDRGRLSCPAQGIQNKLFFSQRHSLLLELLPPWRPR
nr:MAG TPA: hypothetical protein [Caudoviricetes sp.]